MIRKFCKSIKAYPCCCIAIAGMFLLAILALNEKAYIASVIMVGIAALTWNVMFGKSFDNFVQAMKSGCNKSPRRKYYEKELPGWLKEYPEMVGYHMMIERKLMEKGYQPEDIISPAFVSRINNKIASYFSDVCYQGLSDVDIAAFIMEDLVDDWSELEFVADMFDCVKHMLVDPVFYYVTVKNEKVKLDVVESERGFHANPDKLVEQKGGRKAFAKYFMERAQRKRASFSGVFIAMSDIYQAAIGL